LFPPVPQGYSQITKLIHRTTHSLTQFKKVFSVLSEEIHTYCAKKNIILFLAGIVKSQNGLSANISVFSDAFELLKPNAGGLYHKIIKVNINAKPATAATFSLSF
jgi:hypothetical protein